MKLTRIKANLRLFIYSSIFSLLPFLLAGCNTNSKYTKEFSKLQHSLVSADSSVFNKLSKQPVVYYFHFTRRCATCNAVEKITKEALTEFYDNKISFTDYNLDEPEGEAKGKELEVAGQTLLIVANGKKINLTNEAFMNAKSNPEKLKQIIKEQIDILIK